MTATPRAALASGQPQIALIALVVAALAAADWYVRPERALTWMVGLGTMAGVWLMVTLIGRTRLLSPKTESEARFVVLSALVAGLMLIGSLGLALAHATGVAGAAVVQRAPGVMMGLMLVVIANGVPKVLGPMAARRCAPARVQSLQRFTGWVFVLAGLGYAAAWVVAEVSLAETVSTALCAGALVLVLGRLLFLGQGGGGAEA